MDLDHLLLWWPEQNFDVHFRNKTNLPVHVSEDPLLTVVKGTGIVLDNLKKYSKVLIQP